MIGSVIGAVFLVIGLLILAHGVRGCYLAIASSSWLSTIGTVAVSNVEGNSDARGALTYRPRVEYRYNVGGNEFAGDCLYFGDWVELPVSFMARQYTDRYRRGSEVTVFYDPREPSNAVLEPGFHGVILYGCAGGFLFALMGALTLYQQM